MKTTKILQRLGVIVLILAAMLSMVTPCFAAEEADIVTAARNGVVRIYACDPETGDGCFGTGFGVGTAGEETDCFVTNWHVVTCLGEYEIGALDVYIMLSNDAITENENGFKHDFSEMIKCKVVYSADTYPDVAILQAERKVPGRVALPLKSSREVAVGSRVYTLGYPGAADTVAVNYDNLTAFKYADVESVHINGGIVSKLDAFGLFGDTYCVEHDAHINNGNSGGPLVDEHGNVVGINTYGVTSDDFLNYSVFTDYAMDYLNQLGIAYDYVGMEAPFPVVPVAVGAAVVVLLAVGLIVLKIRRAKRKTAVDTGLRVQFDAGAMLANKRYVINGTLRFGRAEDCNIRYEEKSPGISSHHCEILVEKTQVYIRDLNSSHGTFVNGSRIASNQMVPLSVGAEVSLGGPKECFKIVRSTKK